MQISQDSIIPIVVQLYAVMNPLVAIPKFLEVVESTEGSFFRMVNRVFFAILLLTTLFVLGGNYILSIFGISLSSLKIAGGIILLSVAIDTLITGHKPEKVETGDLIVVPIATPLIVGPG
ncbi:MAG: MarC family protein, partial [Fervidicoccaceae archaeon]